MGTFFTFSVILAILSIGLWFWALIDLARSRFNSPIINLGWLVVIIIFPMVGSIAYFFLKNRFARRGRKRFQPKFNNS